MRQIDQETGIEQQRNLFAVFGDAGLFAQRRILRLPPRAQAHALRVVLFHVGRRADVHVTHRAIDDNRVARIDDARGVGDLPDRRDAARARHD